MTSLIISGAIVATIPNSSSIHHKSFIRLPVSSLPILHLNKSLRLAGIARSRCSLTPHGNGEEQWQPETLVEELSVPHHWLQPSKALEESEWLKFTLQKWLDDEYCPEPTNLVISEIAARSYYESLLQKQTDLGEILLKMARELESISYQESFHGAFSSANAAVNLITQRIENE